MPWHIIRSGEKYCVIKDDDGSKAGCHPTRAEAIKQLRALYANEKNMNASVVAVGEKDLTVLLAESLTERALGLSGREEAEVEADGMLFIRPREDIATFHMTDVRFPITIGFYDRDGKLVATKQMVPGLDAAYRPEKPFKYALEVLGLDSLPEGDLTL